MKWLERLTLKARILCILALSILIIVGIALFQYSKFATVEDLVVKMYRHPVTVASVIKDIDHNILLIHREMKDIALGKDLVKAQSIVDKIHLETLEKFKILNERFLGDKKEIEELQQSFVDWKEVRQKVITYKLEGNVKMAAKVTMTEGVESIEKLTDKIDKIQSFADDKLQGFYGAVQENISHASNVITLVTIIAAIAFIIISFLIINSIVKPLQRLSLFSNEIAQGNLTATILTPSNNEIDSLGKQMALMRDSLKGLLSHISSVVGSVSSSSVSLEQMVEQFSNATKEQTSGLEQISTAVDEMSATVSEVARNAQVALDAATQTYSDAQEGTEATKQVTSQASELVVNTTDISNTLKQLESETKNVESVLDMIREISDQTNLLALNAAIEAARAGDHGRGFAVVADEVRTLAAKTQSSVEEVQETISNLQSKSISSVEKMERNYTMSEDASKLAELTSESLHKIIDSANNIQDMNTLIATASEEQSVVAGDISKNVSGIYTNSKEVMAEIGNIEASANELKLMSSELKLEVDKFRI